MFNILYINSKCTKLRRAWRYQRGNHNPYIEEQTTQWLKEKVQKDKQRSTKHTHKTKKCISYRYIYISFKLSDVHPNDLYHH